MFRLRFGDYRIIYSFDARKGWVALLGVDNRKDVYKHGQLVADDLTISLDEISDEDELLQREPPAPTWEQQWRASAKEEQESDIASAGAGQAPAAAQPTPLPKAPDAALLRQLRVPQGYHEALLDCRTDVDLLAVEMPESMRDRVFDALFPQDFNRVLQQPTLLLKSPDDLARFYEGSLTHFLLQLNPEQQRFVDWAVNGSGPALVKGGPGTGKTIIALYRVRSLIAALRRSGIAQPRILFTSYVNALVESSRQLLQEVLGSDLDLVTLRTADRLVSDIVYHAGAKPKKLLNDAQARTPVGNARKRLFHGSAEERATMESIAAFDLDFLREEIDGVIVAREHRELEIVP